MFVSSAKSFILSLGVMLAISLINNKKEVALGLIPEIRHGVYDGVQIRHH